MPLAVPIALPQLWLFGVLSLLFFAFVLRAIFRRGRESGGNRARRSRLGIFLQNVGIALACFGPVRPVLNWSSPAALAAYIAITLLMGGTVALFASSSTA